LRQREIVRAPGYSRSATDGTIYGKAGFMPRACACVHVLEWHRLAAEEHFLAVEGQTKSLWVKPKTGRKQLRGVVVNDGKSILTMSVRANNDF
jgi:hypothetical protein